MYYDRIDINKEIDSAKSNSMKRMHVLSLLVL